MEKEKFYSRFTEKKSAKADAQNKRKEFNKQRDKYFDDKRRGLDKKEVNFSDKKNIPLDAKILSSANMFNYDKMPADALKVLESFDSIVQSIRPMNSRQMQKLPKDIRALSHQLTDERETRNLSYMNATEQLSAYIRYFTWWNLVRLTRVFANLPSDSLNLKDDSVVIDIGSGPLTVVTALWLARPELRNKKLIVYCMDISQSTMAVGEEIYMSVAAKAVASDANAEGFWKIIRVKGEIGTEIKRRANLITCANMFNELYQKDHDAPEKIADKQIRNLFNYASEDCSFFIAEPGMPVAGRFISLMRERFLQKGLKVASPCPHQKDCPMNGLHARYGGSEKWCNFSFSTENAPSKLLKLSESAGLPKERAVISFIMAQPEKIADKKNQSEKDSLSVAIVSDPIYLAGHRQGFYSCSENGMVLVVNAYGKKIKSGDVLEFTMLRPYSSLQKDKKSGAPEITI